MATGADSLVRSTERVRDLGEVLTPPHLVEEMLDHLPEEVYAVGPAATFLEPACGDGNFLVAVLARKLERVLSTGGTDRAAQVVRAASTLYGIDISEENIHGFPGGEIIGARERLRRVALAALAACGAADGDEDPVVRSATWTIEQNVRVGDMNPMREDGSPSGPPAVDLYLYEWADDASEVTVRAVSIADALELASSATKAQLTLGGPPEPRTVWSGSVDRLHEAPQLARRRLRGRR
jgi:hypothetical protein